MRGRELVGEAGREWLLLLWFSELPRCLDAVAAAAAVLRLVSECWRPSAGKSSPKTFCRRLWKPRPMLDLLPVLLTVFWLCTEGRRSSLSGNPMASSRSRSRPVLGRNVGDDTSSLESKKLCQLGLDMALPDDHGAPCDCDCDCALGGFLEMAGTRLPDVSSTASCWRWLELERAKGFGRWEGSLGGGGGGAAVPGDIWASFSMLHRGGQRGLWLVLVPCLSGGGAGTGAARWRETLQSPTL